MNPVEGIELEAGPLLIRAATSPCSEPESCSCTGIAWLIGSVPEWGLDRWALVGMQPPPVDVDALEEAYSGEEDRELARRFIAAFGVRWDVLDERLLNGQKRLWRVQEVQDWLGLEETTCEQLLVLRTYTGDRPSQASRAIVLMAEYRAVVQ